MRMLLSIVALSTALTSTPAFSQDLCRCLGLGCLFGCDDKYGCGSGCEPGCGCDSGCGCDVGCGADVGCCEPACGCGAYCANGRSYAGQTWDCGCESGPRLCPCTDECGNCAAPSGGCLTGDCGCGESCGCGDVCGCGEPTCGCEAGCGCEPACGCGDDCGGCGRTQSCVGKDWFGCQIFARVGNCLCGCSGCDSEVYWCEWHNDPPRCCDPCDRCGNWVGPGAGYRAPYDHPYSVNAGPNQMQYANKVPHQQNRSAAIAKKPPRPMKPQGRVARRPYTGPAKIHQR